MPQDMCLFQGIIESKLDFIVKHHDKSSGGNPKSLSTTNPTQGDSSSLGDPFFRDRREWISSCFEILQKHFEFQDFLGKIAQRYQVHPTFRDVDNQSFSLIQPQPAQERPSTVAGSASEKSTIVGAPVLIRKQKLDDSPVLSQVDNQTIREEVHYLATCKVKSYLDAYYHKTASQNLNVLGAFESACQAWNREFPESTFICPVRARLQMETRFTMDHLSLIAGNGNEGGVPGGSARIVDPEASRNSREVLVLSHDSSDRN